jgi:hypothetical protein
MQEKRATIAPVDGHEGTMDAGQPSNPSIPIRFYYQIREIIFYLLGLPGAQAFQGCGHFTGSNTIKVNVKILQLQKAVISRGGQPVIPKVPGLADALYTTNAWHGHNWHRSHCS